LMTNHNDNDKENDMAVVATATAIEEQSMICMEEKEGVMNMQEMWSNMALMSPTHSLGYYEYEYIHEDFQDEEVSLWSF
jgi:hypothetical protein